VTRWKPYLVSNTTSARISGESEYYEEIWDGVALYSVGNNNHITDGRVIINERRAPEWTNKQKHQVMCQENGHLGRLEHRDGVESCMRQNIYVGANEDFDDHDRKILYNVNDHRRPSGGYPGARGNVARVRR